MEMNLTVPAAYILFFVLLLAAGLLGYFIRSCCFWLEKDELKKATSAESSTNLSIVVDPSKPDHGHQSLHIPNKPVKGVHVRQSLPGPTPNHSYHSRSLRCTSI